jgi:hypothetical protein
MNCELQCRRDAFGESPMAAGGDVLASKVQSFKSQGQSGKSRRCGFLPKAATPANGAPQGGQQPADCTQVVDNSLKEAKSGDVSRLIFRGLQRKRAFFDPFLTCKGVGFPSLTEKAGDLFPGQCQRLVTSSPTFIYAAFSRKPLRQAMASEGCRRLAALMAGTKATISGGKRASGGQIRQITPLNNFLFFEKAGEACPHDKAERRGASV